MSLIYQLFVSQVQLSKIKSILKILIISIGISGNVSAQTIHEYCLSTVGKIETTNEKTKVFDPTPPLPYFIDSVENLPELYEKPCNKFYRFVWGECERKTFFSYSPTLNRVFIQGHRRTDWRGDFSHLEISPSGTKSVPESLVNSDFSEDISTLGGVLFRGDLEGEALFYNGNKVTNLSNYFPQSKNRKQGFKWDSIQTFDGRTFLAVDFVRTQGNPFIMELKPGLRFRFIPVPKELKNTLIDLFTLPKDSRIWAKAGKNILVEVNGELQNIIEASSLPNISGPIKVEQLADGSISFQVKNRSSELTTNYFLRQASPKANCEIILDINKPVKLEPELKN
ncbi:MAG: hypothetical protein AAGE84_31310 [Cyanobacteria bacterium P01_G01_bin.39]